MTGRARALPPALALPGFYFHFYSAFIRHTPLPYAVCPPHCNPFLPELQAAVLVYHQAWNLGDPVLNADPLHAVTPGHFTWASVLFGWVAGAEHGAAGQAVGAAAAVPSVLGKRRQLLRDGLRRGGHGTCSEQAGRGGRKKEGPRLGTAAPESAPHLRAPRA